MYLDLLNQNEQMNFLELAHHSMGLDGIHHENEKEVFNSYKYECQLIDYEISKQSNIGIVIDSLCLSSMKNKRIILLELFGILLADGHVCDDEQSFMNTLAKRFDINTDELEKIHKWVIAMNQIVEVGYKLITQGVAHV